MNLNATCLCRKMVNFRQPSAFAIVFLLLPILSSPPASNGECSGPQKNKIVSILKDVPWEELDQQLNLNQISYIDGACQREKNPVPCKLREVLNRFINAQTAQSCCETVQKIASALENLPEPRKFEASKLREMCTYTESGTSDLSEPSVLEENQPTHSTMSRASPTPEQENQSFLQENWMILALSVIVSVIVGILTFCYLVFRSISGKKVGSSDQIKLENNNGAYPWQVWHRAEKNLVRYHASEFVIAIVDSGIKKEHISFKSAPPTKPKILPQSKDFTDDHDIIDRCGHGTNCAAIAAGSRDITGKEDYDGGVASEASLLICKVTKFRKYNVNKVIEALKYIKELHEQKTVTTHVVSMSFGFKTDSKELKKCIDDLTDLGIICVAAAGNEGDTPGTKVPFPARYPKVFSIGSHNTIFKLAQHAADPQNNDDIDYTTFGEAVCAAAIDTNVAFGTFSGTSMAAPVAAGLIACVLEHECWPQQTPGTLDQVRLYLNQMTKPGDKLKSLCPFQVFKRYIV